MPGRGCPACISSLGLDPCSVSSGGPVWVDADPQDAGGGPTMPRDEGAGHLESEVPRRRWPARADLSSLPRALACRGPSLGRGIGTRALT